MNDHDEYFNIAFNRVVAEHFKWIIGFALVLCLGALLIYFLATSYSSKVVESILNMDKHLEENKRVLYKNYHLTDAGVSNIFYMEHTEMTK